MLESKKPSGITVLLVGMLVGVVTVLGIAQFGVAFYEFMTSAITDGLAGLKHVLHH